MFAQKKTINNVPQLVPLTADTGSGNPIGTILPLYKKSTPNGYLYCDGSTFDTTAYPGLYAYLGTNVLPDYREFALVGAEENTTDVYDVALNPDGTIHDHDVYAEGQAKDDQLQTHTHDVVVNSGSGGTTFIAGATGAGSGGNYQTQGPNSGRIGAVTRGKRKAVYFYIKATTGLDENRQDYVLNTINENNSYSTTEHATGKKWIDGKPIWRKTIPFTLNNYSTINGWRIFNTSIDISSLNIDNYIKQENTIIWSNTTSGHTGRKLNVESQINAQGNITTGGHVSIEGNICGIQTFQAESIYTVIEITGSVTLEYTKI